MVRDLIKAREHADKQKQGFDESLKQMEDRRRRDLRSLEVTYDQQLQLQGTKIEMLKASVAERDASIKRLAKELDSLKVGYSDAMSALAGDNSLPSEPSNDDRPHLPSGPVIPAEQAKRVPPHRSAVSSLSPKQLTPDKGNASSSLNSNNFVLQSSSSSPPSNSTVCAFTPHHGNVLISTSRNAWKRVYMVLDSSGNLSTRETSDSVKKTTLFNANAIVRMKCMSTPLQPVAMAVDFRPSPSGQVQAVELAFQSRQDRTEWVEYLKLPSSPSPKTKTSLPAADSQTVVPEKLSQWLQEREDHKSSLDAVHALQKDLSSRCEES